MTAAVPPMGRRLILALACFCTVGAGIVTAMYLGSLARVEHLPVPPLDDTYIHLQYARRLMHGHVFSYVPGEGYTTGATSIIYVLLVAPFTLLGDGAATWATFVIGAVSLGGTAFAAGIVARRLAGGMTAPFAAAALVLACGAIGFESLSGMETGLFCAAVTATVALVLVDQAPTRRVFAMLALLPLVRPDGAVFAAVLVAAIAVWNGRGAVVKLLPAFAPFVAYLLVNWLLTGDAATAGMRLKSYSHDIYNSKLHAAWQLLDSARTRLGIVFGSSNKPPMFPLLAAPLAVLGLALPAAGEGRRWSRTLLLGGLIVVGYLALNDSRGNLHGWQRYFAPILPLWAIAAVCGVEGATRLLPPRVRTAVAGVAAALLAVLVWWRTQPEWRAYYAAESQEIANKQVQIARFIRDQLPRGERVITMDVGAVAFIGGHPTFDVIGLTTRDIYPYALLEVPGRVEAIGGIPREERPHYAALYGSSLPHELSRRVLAQARGFLLYEIDWAPIDAADAPEGPLAISDAVDVADPRSEKAHAYDYRPNDLGVGQRAFTRVSLIRGVAGADSARPVRYEEMNLAAHPDKDATLVLRTDGAALVSVDWDGLLLPLQAAPVNTEQPSAFVEMRVTIPAAKVRAMNHVISHSQQAYRAYHWFLLQ